MEGRRATHAHAHAHALTYSLAHSGGQSVCGALTHPGHPEAPGQCLGARWGQAQQPPGGAVPGGGGTEPGNGFLKGTRKPPEALLSALDLRPPRTCTAQPSPKRSLGKDGHFDDFKLPEETWCQTFGLWPGKPGLHPGQLRPAQGGEDSRRPGGGATPTGKQFLTTMLPAPGVRGAMRRTLCREHAPRGGTLKVLILERRLGPASLLQQRSGSWGQPRGQLRSPWV